MRATVARLAPQQRRGTAFGIVNAVYGAAWFAGSVLLGVLYDHSIWGVVVASAVLQLTAAADLHAPGQAGGLSWVRSREGIVR